MKQYQRRLIFAGLALLIIWWMVPDSITPVDEVLPPQLIQPDVSRPASQPVPPEKTPEARDEGQTEPFSMQQATGQRLQQIAQSYKDISQFPAYSIPLTEQDWDLLNPMAFTAVKQVLDPARGLTASLSVPAYILYKGQDIEFRLQLKSDQTLRQTESLPLSIKSQGEELHSFNLVPDKSLFGEFSGLYSYEKNADDWPEELQAVVVLDTLLDEHQVVAAGFKYVQAAGELLGIGPSYVEGAHLMIPLQLELNHSGYYRLRMNLMGKQPVSHINSRQKLDQGKVEVLLKVHISTLKAANDPGPYRLQDFNITRLPDKPGQVTRYVQTLMNSLGLSGFPLEDYEDEPYQDPLQQQRQEFFNQLNP